MKAIRIKNIDTVGSTGWEEAKLNIIVETEGIKLANFRETQVRARLRGGVVLKEKWVLLLKNKKQRINASAPFNRGWQTLAQGPTACFLNKTLLKYSHTHSLMSMLLSSYNGRAE